MVGFLTVLGIGITGIVTAVASFASQTATITIIYLLLGVFADNLARLGINFGISLITYTSKVIFEGGTYNESTGEWIYQSGNNLYNNIIRQMIPASIRSQLNVGQLIMAIAFGIIALSVVYNGLKMITSSVTGEETESIQSAIGHSVFAMLLIVAFFGTTWINGTSSRGTVLSGDYNIISMACSGLKYVEDLIGLSNMENITNVTLNTGVGSEISIDDAGKYIFACVLVSSMFMASLNCAITYMERLFSFALFTLMGPIFLALYSFRDMRQVAVNWIKGFFTQLITIALSSLMWYVFYLYLNSELVSTSDITIDLTTTSGVFNLIIGIIILTTCSRSEQILNAVGLQTIPSMDAFHSAIGGAAVLGQVAGVAGNVVSAAGNSLRAGVNSAIDTKKALAGKKSAGAKTLAKNIAKNAAPNIAHYGLGVGSANTGNAIADALTPAIGGANFGAEAYASGGTPVSATTEDMNKANKEGIEKASQDITNSLNSGKSYEEAKKQAVDAQKKLGFSETAANYNVQQATLDNLKDDKSGSFRKQMLNDPKGAEHVQNFDKAMENGMQGERLNKAVFGDYEAVSANVAAHSGFRNTSTGEMGMVAAEIGPDGKIHLTDNAVNNASVAELKGITQNMQLGQDASGKSIMREIDTSNLNTEQGARTSELLSFANLHNKGASAVNSTGQLGGDAMAAYASAHGIETTGNISDLHGEFFKLQDHNNGDQDVGRTFQIYDSGHNVSFGFMDETARQYNNPQGRPDIGMFSENTGEQEFVGYKTVMDKATGQVSVSQNEFHYTSLGVGFTPEVDNKGPNDFNWGGDDNSEPIKVAGVAQVVSEELEQAKQEYDAEIERRDNERFKDVDKTLEKTMGVTDEEEE